MFLLCGVNAKALADTPAGDSNNIIIVDKGSAASSIVLLGTKTDGVMKLSADTINTTVKNWSGVALPIQVIASAEANLPAGTNIILARIDDLARIYPDVEKSNARIAAVNFADEQGFACSTAEIRGQKQLLLVAKTDRGLYNGAIWLRDFCIDGSSKKLSVEKTDILRVPQLAIRGTYCLSIYGTVSQYTVEDWNKVYESFARDGMDRIYFWVSGMFPSEKFPQTFNVDASANTKIRTVAEMKQLVQNAHNLGMKFYLGSGVFAWSTAAYLGQGLPDGGAATKAGGLCPAIPEIRQRHKDYFMEMIDAIPEADGFFFELRDEHGECQCPLCQKPAGEAGSKMYGQYEMQFLQELALEVWKKYPNVRFCVNVGYKEHAEDVAFYQAIGNMRDPRFEWLDCRWSWEYPATGGQKVPGSYISNNMTHWDPAYSRSLNEMAEVTKSIVKYGYNGYSPAFEPGFATADFYSKEIPYPTEIINYAVTGLAYREYTWDPIYASQNIKALIQKKFFGKEASSDLGQDLLDLREMVVLNSKPILYFSQDWLNYSCQVVPHAILEQEVEKLSSSNEARAQGATLTEQLKSLKYMRDSGLPRLDAIEKDMKQARANATPKTTETLDKMQRLIDDTRKHYSIAVPKPELLDEYTTKVETKMTQPAQPK